MSKRFSTSLTPILVFVLMFAMHEPAHGQTAGITPTVVHVVAEPLADRLRVTVFFSLRDERGRPVLQNGDNAVVLDSAGTISLRSPRGPDAVATVGDPQTPLNLLFLIDTSGSMATPIKTNNGERRIVLDDVKIAAVKALDAAPAGTKLAVARFDDVAPDAPLPLMQQLTPALDQAGASINAIKNPIDQAPTCMFNASYQGIEYLRNMVTRSEERRAVLLFTDGRDERADGSKCSTRNPEDVAAHARTNSTALYTIGLCTDATCANVDKPALSQLAEETSAVATAGSLDQIDDLFGLIMNELNSQWAITADVYPRQGLNTGLLEVTAAGRLFSQEFPFMSDRDYNAPPAFEVRPAYDPDNDRFTLQVDVTNEENLETATLEVWDSAGGILVRSQPIDGPGTLEVATEGMRADREYLFRVRATAKGGIALLGPEASPYIIEQLVTYEPRLAFAIDAASADWDNNRLLVDVRVRGAGGIEPIFDGQVTNEQGAELIPINRAALNEAGRLELPIPATLGQTQSEQKLTIRLVLVSDAAPVEGEFSFSVLRPAQPFPWTLVLLGAGVLALGGYVILRLTRRGSVADGLALAPLVIAHNNPSGEIAVAPGAPRLRIRVVSSPDQREVRAEVITSFPCVVGAGVGADFVVRGASTVSRTHLQITHNTQSGFEVSDVSRHGTYRVEGTRLEQLKPKTPIILRGPVQLSLAKEIVLDLEPL